MKRVFILYSLLFMSALASVSGFDKKENSSFSAGAYLGYNLNNHTAGFSKLPGIPNCCPKFESGFGTGFNVGGILDYPLSSAFSVQLRAGYSILDGILKDNEQELMNFNGTAENGTFEHILDSKLSLLFFEPGADLLLFGNFSVFMGIPLGAIRQFDFSQREEIVKPADRGTFLENDSRVRNKYSGKIPNAAKFYMGLKFGARYLFKLNSSGSLNLAPELSYTFGLTDIAENINWKANSFTIAAGVIYSFGTAKITEELPEPEIPDKPVKETKITKTKPETAILAASVRAVAIKDGVEMENAEISIEEFLSTRMVPLLNYVFFDDNSYELPERYKLLKKGETGQFDYNSLFNHPVLTTYYNLLNIIAVRMLANKEADITLNGCNSGIGDENGNTVLSGRRAEAVAAYLENTWNIAPDRIKVRFTNLPDKPSNQDTEDGIQENRRVEILSDDSDILKPVIMNDTLREVTPPLIRFYPAVESTEGIDNWELTIMQGKAVLKTFEGKGDVPDHLDWKINSEKETIPSAGTPVEYFIRVTDKKGKNNISSQGSIQITMKTLSFKKEERMSDIKQDDYRLILFDFDRAAPDEKNRNIAKFIKSKVQPDSKVEITGYTDRVGEASYNRRLSENRAKEISTILNKEGAMVKGYGENTVLYDNNLPEGRFYSRTVKITVQTPIKW